MGKTRRNRTSVAAQPSEALTYFHVFNLKRWMPGRREAANQAFDLYSNEKYTGGNWISLSFQRMNFLAADYIESSGGVNIPLGASGGTPHYRRFRGTFTPPRHGMLRQFSLQGWCSNNTHRAPPTPPPQRLFKAFPPVSMYTWKAITYQRVLVKVPVKVSLCFMSHLSKKWTNAAPQCERKDLCTSGMAIRTSYPD